MLVGEQVPTFDDDCWNLYVRVELSARKIEIDRVPLADVEATWK